MKMDIRQRKALAICFNKKRKITEEDLMDIYIQPHTRKNFLRYAHHKGYLMPDPEYGMAVNPDSVQDIYEELIR